MTAAKEAHVIAFDLAVTASREKGGGLGGKVNVFAAEVGLDGKGKTSHEEVSRVKFSVSLARGIT